MKSGEYTKKAIEKRSRKLAEMLQLEDVCAIVGVINGARTRGRKPLGYKPLKTAKDAWLFVLDKELNSLEPRHGAQDK
jgi:hypothetical protein